MENEAKAILLLSLVLFLLVGNLIFFGFYTPVTGSVINEPLEKQYSFTKALCDGNVCQDFEISCKNEQVVYQKPVSEKIYFPENWRDKRTEEDITELC